MSELWEPRNSQALKTLKLQALSTEALNLNLKGAPQKKRHTHTQKKKKYKTHLMSSKQALEGSLQKNISELKGNPSLTVVNKQPLFFEAESWELSLKWTMGPGYQRFRVLGFRVSGFRV